METDVVTKGMVRVLAQILLFIVIEVNVKCDRRNCDNGNDQLKKQGFFVLCKLYKRHPPQRNQSILGDRIRGNVVIIIILI